MSHPFHTYAGGKRDREERDVTDIDRLRGERSLGDMHVNA